MNNGPTRVPVRNGTILFNPITMEDAGWYQCTATHLGNNVSSYSVYLDVGDDLSGVEDTGFRTVQATVGAPVSLKCSDSDGLDRSRGSPCWVREDPTGRAAVTSRGHRMHLDGALYCDTDIYTCQMPPISDVETRRRAKARSFFVKVKNRTSGQRLLAQVTEAMEMLTDYNGRLAGEMDERKRVTRLLQDFTQS